MRLRITKIDEEHFLTCVKRGIWGSNQARFNKWLVGDLLVLLVEKAIAGMAEISGPFEVSGEHIWGDALYPYRIPVRFLHAFLPQNRPLVDGEIKNVLTASWGPHYGLGMVSQRLVEANAGEKIAALIRASQNDLNEIQQNINQLLEKEKRIST